MILAVHIGNSTSKVGFLEGERRVMARVSIHKGMTADDVMLLLHTLADLKQTSLEVDGTILSSVSPTLTGVFAQGIEQLTGVRPLIVGPGVKTGLNIKINDPSELGADLVCMSAGAIAKYPTPVLLLHVGNATTVSYVNENNCFIGTIIAAGLRRMQDSLVRYADLLNPVHLESPAKLLGTDSTESIQSGLIYGSAAMLDGLCDRVREQVEVKTTVITGDHASVLAPHCKTEMVYDETLLFDGMVAILERQERQKKGRGQCTVNSEQ